MKAVLEFQLPEESEEFRLAQRGRHYISVIEELDNYLRSILKYEERSAEVHDALQAVRDKLWQLREED